jgi:hypothetical protein
VPFVHAPDLESRLTKDVAGTQTNEGGSQGKRRRGALTTPRRVLRGGREEGLAFSRPPNLSNKKDRAQVNVTKWDGKPISKPGWYSGIPIEKYHSAGICKGLAVSSSNLRTCWSKSPAHMFSQWCENPKAEVRVPSNAMLRGAVSHHLLLGEDNFRLKYIPHPPTYRDKVTAVEKPWHNGAAYCKAWNEQQVLGGKVVVKREDILIVKDMAASLVLEPLTPILLRGLVEHSGFVRDKETGLWIKVRPDVIPAMGDGDFVDLKTAADVTTPALQHSIRAYGYHQQGGLIWEIADQLGMPFTGFVLMFIETAAPFCARTVPLAKQDLENGRLMNRSCLRRIATCITNKRWPGPGDDDIRELPISNDERARTDERLKREGLK